MNTVSRPIASASRRLLSLAAFAAALPLVPSVFGQNLNSTLAASGGTANWGAAATWESGSVPNAIDAVVNISGAFSGGMSLDLQDAGDVNQTYIIGNLTFKDTTSTFRDLTLQNGTLNINTASKAATWTQDTASGGSQALINIQSTASITAAADQSLLLTVVNNPSVTATDTVGPAFRFNSANTWTNFLGTLTLGKGVFQANGNNVLPQAIAINLGSGTDAAYLRLNVGQSQTITALNGNAQSFIHSQNTGTNPVININGAGNGSFAGTIGTNGHASFSRAGININKTGAGTQTFTGTITNNGTVTVGGGTVVYDGATISTTGNTTVNTGGTLRVANTVSQGSGINGGRIVINSGGALTGAGTLALSDVSSGFTGVSMAGNFAPGNAGIGTFTVNAAGSVRSAWAFEGTGTLSFELGAGFTSDRLALVGGSANDIFFNNNVISFTDLTAGSLSTGAYTLFSSDVAGAYSGLTVDGGGFVTGGLTISSTFLIDNTAYTAANLQLVGNDIVLNLTGAGIPEPSTAAVLAGLGVLGLAASRRRRAA